MARQKNNHTKRSIYLTPPVNEILDKIYAQRILNKKRTSFSAIINEALMSLWDHEKEQV